MSQTPADGWRTAVPAQRRSLLGLLAPRGVVAVRAPTVQPVEVGDHGDGTRSVVYTDSAAGTFRLLLHNLRVDDPADSCADPARWLLHAPFRVHEDADAVALDLSGQFYLPETPRRITADRLDVEVSTRDCPPGSCRGCGSKRLLLRLGVWLDVDVVDEGRLRVAAGTRHNGDGVVPANFDAATARAECARCGAAHPAATFGTVWAVDRLPTALAESS